MNRRSFLAATAVAAFQDNAIERVRAAASAVAGRSPEEVAKDDDYWTEIRNTFTVDRTTLNLNNGHVCPSPRSVRESLRSFMDYSDLGPYHMSVGLNIALSVQLRRARATLRPTGFLNGDSAPAPYLRSHTGSSEKLTFEAGGQRVLLYCFSPSCGWRRVHLRNFMTLDAQSAGRRRFIAVSTAPPLELRAYATENGLALPLYSITPEKGELCRLAGTPTTLFISAEGSLLRRWVGAYSPAILREIEGALSIKLPGLVARVEQGATQ